MKETPKERNKCCEKCACGFIVEKDRICHEFGQCPCHKPTQDCKYKNHPAHMEELCSKPCKDQKPTQEDKVCIHCIKAENHNFNTHTKCCLCGKAFGKDKKECGNPVSHKNKLCKCFSPQTIDKKECQDFLHNNHNVNCPNCDKKENDWEEELIIEVMEDYISVIEDTSYGGFLDRKEERRRKHFEKLKSFIAHLLSKQKAQTYQEVLKTIKGMPNQSGWEDGDRIDRTELLKAITNLKNKQ